MEVKKNGKMSEEEEEEEERRNLIHIEEDKTPFEKGSHH